MKIRLYLSTLLLIITLTSSFLLPLTPAVASSQLQWEEVDKPGIRGRIVVNPSDISNIAVSRGNIIYAVDGLHNNLYRSDNGGYTWTEITNNLIRAGATDNFTDVAVAADGPAFVAVVADGYKNVYVSSDSGVTWNDTKLDEQSIYGNIQCIAISSSYRTSESSSETKHDIVVGTASWNDSGTNGELWMLPVGTSFPSWISQVTGYDFSKINFSPNYNTDHMFLAVATSNSSGPFETKLHLGERNFSSQTSLWDTASSYGSDYPKTLSGSSSGDGEIISSLSLPSDFNGQDITNRYAFVSYCMPNASPSSLSNLYRVDNANIFPPVALGDNVTSIAYKGTLQTGNLLVGCMDQQPSSKTVMIKYTPTSKSESYITLKYAKLDQLPTGPGNANVAWGYTTTDNVTPAFCSTGRLTGDPNQNDYDESALSRSTDYGYTWEQTSLINTNLAVSDIAPFPDSKGLLMTTYSPNGPEGIWRCAGDPIGRYWGRLKTINATTNRLIIRVSPHYEDDYTVYIAVVDNKTLSSGENAIKMLSTHTRGNYWKEFYIPWPVIDFAVQDNRTLYMALDGGYVRKTADGGINWGNPVWSGLDDINMLSLTPNGHILVGSQDCKVAYSSDGGASFTVLGVALDELVGDTQVIADPDYVKNHIIYATDNLTDSGIWRWTIGSSIKWTQIDEPVANLGEEQSFCGLATGPEGTLYALRSENTTIQNGGMNRTLNPTDPNEYGVLWDEINHTIPVGTGFNPLINFSHTLPHLKISGNANQNDLWAVDLNNNNIYRFTDDICKVGPTPIGADSAGCDPATGRSQDIDLRWEQPSLGDLNEVQLAKDANFSTRQTVDAVLQSLEPVDNPYFKPVEEPGLPAACILPGDYLECGNFFYWRVRVRHAVTTENITSPWSVTKKFAVQPGYQVTTPGYGVKLLNPENGCSCPCSKQTAFSWSPYFKTTLYRFQLAENAEMKSLLIDTTVQGTTSYLYSGDLQCGRSYFWRVKAVQPVQSDWSATFNLKTQASVSAASETILPRTTPAWIWVLIGMCLVLSVCMFVLILRRYRDPY